MSQKIIVFLYISIFILSCTSTLEKYISTQSEMNEEKKEALRNKEIIPGMTSKEVILILGEPQVKKEQENGILWTYKNVSGISPKEAYTSDSAFSQGIAFIVPLNYRCQELNILLENNQVCRVEKILQTAPETLPELQTSDKFIIK